MPLLSQNRPVYDIRRSEIYGKKLAGMLTAIANEPPSQPPPRRLTLDSTAIAWTDRLPGIQSEEKAYLGNSPQRQHGFTPAGQPAPIRYVLMLVPKSTGSLAPRASTRADALVLTHIFGVAISAVVPCEQCIRSVSKLLACFDLQIKDNQTLSSCVFQR